MWEIREQAVQFQETLQLLHTRIMHISRSLNVLAHNCAREAKTLSRVSLLCSCSNSTHRSSSCPVSVAINRLLPSGTIFVSVQCLWVMELGCSPPYLCSKKKQRHCGVHHRQKLLPADLQHHRPWAAHVVALHCDSNALVDAPPHPTPPEKPNIVYSDIGWYPKASNPWGRRAASIFRNDVTVLQTMNSCYLVSLYVLMMWTICFISSLT
jgi:hypothetical protein